MLNFEGPALCLLHHRIPRGQQSAEPVALLSAHLTRGKMNQQRGKALPEVAGIAVYPHCVLAPRASLRLSEAHWVK